MRIGILHARFLGDAVLATPLIKSLVATPHEIVHLAPTQLRKIADLIPWGRWRYLNGEPPRHIQAEERLDVLILPATLDSQARWAFESGIPSRVGRPRPSAEPWLTATPEPLPGRHESAWILALLQPLGISAVTNRLTIDIPKRAREWAEIFLGVHDLKPGGFTLFCPFSNRVSSEWTRDGWRGMADRLAAEGERVVVDAPPGRTDTSQYGDVVSTDGKSSIPELAALIALSRVTVTIDSASMHIAAAIGGPTVALFGPTPPSMYGGYPLPFLEVGHPPSCGPCFRSTSDWPHKPETCPHPYECMRSISVEETFSAWRKLTKDSV